MLTFDETKPVYCPVCGAGQKDYVDKQRKMIITTFDKGNAEEVWHFTCFSCGANWRMKENER